MTQTGAGTGILNSPPKAPQGMSYSHKSILKKDLKHLEKKEVML